MAAGVPGGAGPAMLKEGERDLGWYWSSDVRTTALVLSALLEIAPTDPTVPRLERGLLGARVEGRWSSTQENVYTLVALADVAKARSAGGDAAVVVTVGGGAPERRTVRAGVVERVRVPLDRVGAGPIVIDSGAREIFYAARLHVERPLGDTALDRGLAVTREYLDPDTNLPVAQIRLGQTVKVRLIVRSPARRAHVAVVDRLPAGFEPIITRFRTSYTGGEASERGTFWWWREQTAWQNLELRDDRAQLFADLLVAGESRHEYLVRATTVGAFAAPPSTVEAMYEPRVAGRSTAGKVVVIR
jgi:alpha-2-macroglobulin